MQDLLDRYEFDRVIAFKPTGWTFSKYRKSNFDIKSLQPIYVNAKITIIPIPYSEHSSFDELADFVFNIDCEKIIPTVNTRNDNVMQKYFKEFKTKNNIFK